MAAVRRAVVTAEIGRMENFPLPVVPGYASYLNAQQLWALSDPAVGGVREHILYNDALDCLMLEPQNPMGVVTDQSLTDYDILPAGAMVARAVPDYHNETGTSLTMLVTSEVSPTANVIVTTKSLAPANPVFYCLMKRAQQVPTHTTPPQLVDRQYSLTFGEGYLLQWSVLNYPTLTTPDGTVYTQKLDMQDYDAYALTTNAMWLILVRGDRLLIQSNLLSGTWTIAEPNGDAWVVPAAKITFESTKGGHYSLALAIPQFNLYGRLITKWIEHYHEYDDSEMVTNHYPPFPVQPVTPADDTVPTVTWSVYETRSVSGQVTQKRYKLELACDALRTPYLSAIQYRYPPVFTPATDAWIDISDYLKQGSERFTYEMGPNQCSMTFDLWKTINDPSDGLDKRFADYLGGTLSGLCSFRYSIGYYYDDGTNDMEQRLLGICDVRSSSNNLTDKTLTITVYDRWLLLALNTVMFAPCGVDEEPHLAIKRWLQWGGIPEEDMVLEPIHATPPSMEMQKIDYNNPPWQPEMGAKLDEMVKRYASAYGLRVEFLADGTAWVHPETAGYGVFHYTTDQAEAQTFTLPTTHALTSVQLEANMSDAVNRVVTRGIDKDGNAILYSLWEPLAFDPTSELYMGIWATQVIADDNLMTQEQVTGACWEAFLHRKAGNPTLQVTTPYALWNRSMGDIVTITDEAVGIVGRRCRLTDRTVTLGALTHFPVSATLTTFADEGY